MADDGITHVILNPVLCNESLCGPVEILLDLDDRIVIHQTIHDNSPIGVHPLTPHDKHGVRLVEIPNAFVQQWLTPDEAEAILLQMADEWSVLA
jgi:hypothetical protein